MWCSRNRDRSGRTVSDTSYAEDTRFVSLKRNLEDRVNLIVTDIQDFCDKYLAASYVCKKLNLMSREDRVMVHEAVRDLKHEYDGEHEEKDIFA